MNEPNDVVILCGGRGTRLQEHTQAIPKPLVEIGGEPILWHVIQIYAARGYRRFWLATG
jgi:glucose-1-phosphate cytidylyltransferase